jgi:sugar lactone lactonase YvrE
MTLRGRAFSVAVAVAAALVAGCADTGPVRGTLRYGLEDAPEGRRLLWPAAPEVPRFLYAGTLTGEPNFRQPEADSGWRRVGRWLVGLDGRSAPPVVLQRPGVITGDDAGRVFVSDASRQAVFVFDEPGGALAVWERADNARNFVAPSGMAATADRLYVADAALGAVFVLGRDGTPERSIGGGQLTRPTGVARDAAGGRLYVADTYAHDIKVFDDAGRLLRTFGRRGEGDGEFNFPTHLALAAGELYVTDTMNNRVQVLDAASGALRRSLGARGLYVGNLVRPKGVAVDADGNVYIVESYYDSLLVFSREGEFLMPIGGTGTATGRFYLPAGVWVDAKNRVHVADMYNGRVVLFQFLGGG